MSIILFFSCATALSMEAPEEASREYQESAPTMGGDSQAAPPAYQEAAPIMEKLGGYNATADAVVNETSAAPVYQKAAPVYQKAAPVYQKAAPVMEKLAGENATAESEPPEYQKTAPNIPGFGICPTLSMLLTGFIIFSRKYSLR
jgi:hypothetical protein